jgi:hypothetical protein
MESRHKRQRFILWRLQSSTETQSVGDLIDNLPGVELIRVKNPNMAVAYLSRGAQLKISQRFPELQIEPDIQHQLAAD